MFPSLCQLPQCLCIHLQRLTWSSEGTPIKRQEHVQFTEYLSMDRYKHNSSAQRSQRVKCAPSPIRPENSDDSTAKPIANGTGTLDFSSLWFNPVSHSDLFFFCRHTFVFCFQMQNIATTTTNLSPTGHVRLYSFTLLVLAHSSASRTTTGKITSAHFTVWIHFLHQAFCMNKHWKWRERLMVRLLMWLWEGFFFL